MAPDTPTHEPDDGDVAYERPPEVVVPLGAFGLTGVDLVATGGWCAPVGPVYDFFALRPCWEYPDDNPFLGVDIDRVVAPRLTSALTAVRRVRDETRTRVAMAWRVLRSGPPSIHDDWTDE